MKHTTLLVLCMAFSLAPFQKNFSFTKIKTDHIVFQDAQIKISNEITNNLSKRNFEDVRKDFSNSLKEKLSAEMVGQAWDNLISQLGAFQSINSSVKSNVQGYDQVKVRCRFEKDNANVEVTFNDDNKVIGLFLKP